MTTQGRERAKDQELQAQRTANRNLRTRVGMLEATLKGREEKDSKKDAVYARDRIEGNNMINQTRAKLGQSEKKVSDLNKEMEEKQLLLSGLYAEKVHAVNKAARVEDELDELKGEYQNLWKETKRLYNHTSGRAAKGSVEKGIQEMSAVLEKLQLSVEELKKEHVELFRPATEEDGTEMEAEIEATPNCTGNKRQRERSRSLGSSPNLRTPAPAVVGVGKTAAWLKLQTFEQIAIKLDFGESCGNARGKMKNAEEQPQVIDPMESTWNEIVRMGNPHIVTGESGDGSGGGAAAAPPNEGKGKKEVKSKPAGQGKMSNDLIWAAG